jgi:hypothetical protein
MIFQDHTGHGEKSIHISKRVATRKKNKYNTEIKPKYFSAKKF